MRARSQIRCTGTVLSSVLLFVSATAAHANGFRNPPETPSQLARTGGKIAFTDDAGAISINPANLADLERAEFLQSLTLIYSESAFDGPRRSGETTDPWKFLPNFFFAAPLGSDGVAMGIGLHTPYGQSTEWDRNGPFAFTAPYFAELITMDIRPVVAWRINDRLAIGGGLDVMWSQLTLEQQFPWGLVTGSPLDAPGIAQFEGDGVGIGGNAALTITPVDGHRVAVTYRSQVEIEYEGDFDISRLPAPDRLPGPLGMILSAGSSFDSEITFPNVIGVGYGVDLSEKLRLGIDVEWIEFSTFDELPLDIGNNDPLLPSPSIPENWEDTWTAGFGLEYDVDEHLVLRGGYVWLESPIPEENLAPTLPDSDRHLLSAGFGFETGGHGVDVAYAYSLYDDLTVANNANPAYNGDYDIDSHLLSLSYTYAF